LFATGARRKINMNSIVLGTGSRQRRFYLTAALFAAAVVFAGFAPTFYLKSLFGTPELSTLKLVHGAVFSGWIMLFVTQTWLVARDRRDLHRRVGTAGALLVVVMSIVGYLLAVDSGRRGFSPDSHVTPLSFMAIPLFDLGVFVALVVGALLLRRRSDWHKRLMLLATLSLLPPAIARIAIQFPPAPVLPIAFGGTALIVLGAMIIDSLAHRRLHPAMLCGGLFVIISLPARILIAGTQAWQDFAGWLIS
jgi:hypothetical protein